MTQCLESVRFKTPLTILCAVRYHGTWRYQKTIFTSKSHDSTFRIGTIENAPHKGINVRYHGTWRSRSSIFVPEQIAAFGVRPTLVGAPPDFPVGS